MGDCLFYDAANMESTRYSTTSVYVITTTKALLYPFTYDTELEGQSSRISLNIHVIHYKSF